MTRVEGEPGREAGLERGGASAAAGSSSRGAWLPALNVDRVLILLLCVAVAFDRLSIRVELPGLEYGNVNLRIELVLGVVIAAFGLARYRAGAMRTLGPVEWLLLGWIGLNFVSSALFSPAPRLSLQLSVLLLGLFALYWGARVLLRTRQDALFAAGAWVAVGSVVALLGLGAALLFIANGFLPGISFNRVYHDGMLSMTPMVYSTLWEANIFGSYCMTVGALAAGLGLTPQLRGTRRAAWLAAAVALAYCGVVLSLTRTVWAIAAGVAVLICVAGLRLGLVGWRSVGRALLVPALVGALVGLAVANLMPKISWATDDPFALNYEQAAQVASEAVRNGGRVVLPDSPGATPGPTPGVDESALGDRVGELGSLDTVATLNIRREVLLHAWDGILRRPLMGWGTGAYPFVYPPATGGSYWIPNLELHLLFDTGLVGFAVFLLAMGLVAWRGLRALRGRPAGWRAPHFALFGVLFAAFGLFATYQLTDGSWLGFSWLLLAVVKALAE